mgnify:CR=1 FL=1
MGEYHQIRQDDPGMHPEEGRNEFDPADRVGENMRSDDLKPDRTVGCRGIVEKWDAGDCNTFEISM